MHLTTALLCKPYPFVIVTPLSLHFTTCSSTTETHVYKTFHTHAKHTNTQETAQGVDVLFPVEDWCVCCALKHSPPPQHIPRFPPMHCGGQTDRASKELRQIIRDSLAQLLGAALVLVSRAALDVITQQDHKQGLQTKYESLSIVNIMALSANKADSCYLHMSKLYR